MKLLVDANLSPRVAAQLCEGGYRASHAQDHGPLNASDEAILRRLVRIIGPAWHTGVLDQPLSADSAKDVSWPCRCTIPGR
ncbi:MAG: DUF5615 family PIN-like protein [Pseudonocardiaceae bacterium]